jgi:hypothetical protein
MKLAHNAQLTSIAGTIRLFGSVVDPELVGFEINRIRIRKEKLIPDPYLGSSGSEMNLK